MIALASSPRDRTCQRHSMGQDDDNTTSITIRRTSCGSSRLGNLPQNMHLPTDDQTQKTPTRSLEESASGSRASSKSNPVGVFRLITSNPRPPETYGPKAVSLNTSLHRRARAHLKFRLMLEEPTSKARQAPAQNLVRSTPTPKAISKGRGVRKKPASSTAVWQSPEGSFLFTTLHPGVYRK